MIRWLARRLALGVVTVFVVASVVFLLVQWAPIDPLTRCRATPSTSPEFCQALADRYGLDRPVHVQYGRWLRALGRGDLGLSIRKNRPVAEVLGDALPYTLLLGATALLLDFSIGIAVGTWQAARRYSRSDRALSFFALVLVAMPVFWWGQIMVLVFSIGLDWLPSSGVYTVGEYDLLSFWGRAVDRLRHLILPAVSLGLIGAAATSRFHRSAVLEVLDDDYVRTARAKGLTERRVMLRHAARNALLPAITLLGLSLPFVIGGAVLIEQVFAWPGVGSVLIEAVESGDYYLVTAVAMLTTVVVVGGGILADLLYRVADPRLREDGPS